MNTIKCVLVGDSSVGKSWLITTFITHKNPEGYIPTLFNNFSKVIKVDGVKYNLTLWDTAGHQEYEKLRSLSLQNTDVFVICYAVDNMISFHNTKKWIEELLEYNVPMILCGTKCDIVDGDIVEKSVAKKLVKKYKLYGHVECSSIDLINVNKLFKMSVEAAIAPQVFQEPQAWYCCCYRRM